MIRIERNNAKCLISGMNSAEILSASKGLTYINKSTQFQLSQAWKKLRWAKTKGRPDQVVYFSREIDRLKAEVEVCLLKPLQNGAYELPAGLMERFRGLVGPSDVIDLRVPPRASSGFPYVGKKATPRPYQIEQIQACLDNGCGTIESATGSGKTLCLQEIIRKLGLKTVLVVPNLSILDQTVRRFETYFGKGKIGQYGNGKKKIKDITIACAPSILKSSPSDWKDVQVLISDESHHTASETLERIFYEFIPDAHYRFGATATSYRADGADLAIEGACFPVIHRYSVQQGIAEGYLASPKFVMTRVAQTSSKLDAQGLLRISRDRIKTFQEHVRCLKRSGISFRVLSSHKNRAWDQIS